jgi:uncharacterized protein (TIGR01244 family)
MKKLDARTWVSGQISPTDVPILAAEGVTMIVNNRPDDEEPGQPASAEIERAAKAVGIQYQYLPVESSSLPFDHVPAMTDAMNKTKGASLAFCRSGTRSTWLWALTRAKAGDSVEEIINKAAVAGYDLTPIRPFLD